MKNIAVFMAVVMLTSLADAATYTAGTYWKPSATNIGFILGTTQDFDIVLLNTQNVTFNRGSLFITYSGVSSTEGNITVYNIESDYTNLSTDIHSGTILYVSGFSAIHTYDIYRDNDVYTTYLTLPITTTLIGDHLWRIVPSGTAPLVQNSTYPIEATTTYNQTIKGQYLNATWNFWTTDFQRNYLPYAPQLLFLPVLIFLAVILFRIWMKTGDIIAPTFILLLAASMFGMTISFSIGGAFMLALVVFGIVVAIWKGFV